MVCVVKAASSLRFLVAVFRPSRTMAVILADQRTAAFSLCGLAAARAGRKREDGARKMKNPPADCSGRVDVSVFGCRIGRDAIGQRALMTERFSRRSQTEMNRRRALFTSYFA